jgi:hypothetical protein
MMFVKNIHKSHENVQTPASAIKATLWFTLLLVSSTSPLNNEAHLACSFAN